MTIKIGLFGFGKTGSLAAQEIIKDEQCQLCWVLRKSSHKEGAWLLKVTMNA